MIFTLAVKHFGSEHQTLKACEELTEHELLHAPDGRADNDKIREEMDDVEIMLEHLKLIYGRVEEKKIARLEERIHGANPSTRYDWSKAPKWAQWAARDADGTFCWYKKKPNASKYYEAFASGVENKFDDGDKCCILDASGDWRDSLERRPE